MTDQTWSTYPSTSETILHCVTPPKRSDWQCYLTGGPDGLVLVPNEGNVPNAFHRFMQRVCFGFRWVKKGTE